MAPGQGAQLEKVIDEVLQSGQIQALDVFLQRDAYDGTPIKCSQQFLTKLDKLVSRSLDQKEPKSACFGLAILYKCGKYLKLPGGYQGLPGLISQGLLTKWFEKCRHLWIQCGPQWDETLFNLSEDFFDALVVVHDSCKEGTYKITDSFMYPVGQLAVDPRIYVLIQKEAIRKFNLILDKIPAELKKKKKILSSQEASDIMIKLAGQILEVGDYDLQTALMEALCRMASPEQRKELADRWFGMEHVARAFVKISDAEFETDCRKFLNLVNGMQGDRRRVYSFPCLEVYLDKYELLMPADEKLEEFWIDFNHASHSISFYFSVADEEAQEGQWETICINENEVQSYIVTEEGKKKVLQLKLSQVVVVGAVQGSSLTISFSSSLDILHAACKIYGLSKNKGFVGKTGTSVVKTTVKIIMEETSSQVIPESQVSLGESEKTTAPYLLPAPSAPVQMVTSAKKRMSESVHAARSMSAVMTSNSAKGKGKPSLEMVRSCDRQSELYLGELRTTAKTSSHGTSPSSTKTSGMSNQSVTSLQSKASRLANKSTIDKHKKNISLAKAADMVLAERGEEQSQEHSFVPDTQPRAERNISSNWCKMSVSEMLMMPTQKIISQATPELHSRLEQQQQEQLSSAQTVSVSVLSKTSQKQLCTELTERLQQVLSERNQDPVPQEPAAPQKRVSHIREDATSSADRCLATLSSPKEQPAQRKGLARRKSKAQKSLEAEASLIKAPAKDSTTKALQEKHSPNVMVETKRPLSSKEKRDAVAAGSMVKVISSHYGMNSQSTAKHTAEDISQSRFPPLVNRPVFNMSWLSQAKRDAGTVTVLQSHNKTQSSSTRQRKDIFAFDIDSSLSTGGKDKTLTDTSTISTSGIHDSSVLPSTTKKGHAVAKEKRHVKKHLFSDTDTDYTTTDVSWLRESNQKPKPKVNKYSRQAPVKPKAVPLHTSYEFSDVAPPSPKPVKGNTKPSKKKPDVKERVEQPKKPAKPASASPSRAHATGRRPRRAAAISTKSYREPDTDDSQSDSEKPPVSKQPFTSHLENAEKPYEAAQGMKKKMVSKQITNSYMRLDSRHHSYQSDSELVSEQPPTSKKHFAGQQGENEKTFFEVPEVKERKNTSTDTCRRLDSKNQSHLIKPSGLKQQRPENVLPETSKFNKRNVVPAQEQWNALKDSWAARSAFSPSPPSIERMRTAQRSAPALGLTCSPLLSPRGSPLPASPDPPCHDTPSPILLLAKPRSTVSSKGNIKPSSFYNAGKKCISSKTHSVQSTHSILSLTKSSQTPAYCAPTALKISPVQQCLPSPSPLCLSTLPILTSTLLELDKPSMPSPINSPFPEDTVSPGCHYGFSKVSSVFQVSLSQSSTKSKSSVLTSRVKDSPDVSHKPEKTPASGRHKKPSKLHMSGPSRKRHVSSSTSSISEDDEKEEQKKSQLRVQRSPRMKPRKLFKSSIRSPGPAQSWGGQSSSEEEEHEESRPKERTFKLTKERLTKEFQNINKKTTHATVDECEVSQLMSSFHTVSSSHWEEEEEDEDLDMEEDLQMPNLALQPSNMYQQFSSELKKKFQNRCQMVEVYNKHSLKTVQQHVTSINTEVTKFRTQRLEQVQEVLLDEIHKLEQEDTMLKSMEKDLTVYWKKQTTAFHSYQEHDTRRNETLANALQSNVCHSLEYEQRIFTSQMGLIRNDMKSVQDRLLSQMQEGEIRSVKRGLHALFFP